MLLQFRNLNIYHTNSIIVQKPKSIWWLVFPFFLKHKEALSAAQDAGVALENASKIPPIHLPGKNN